MILWKFNCPGKLPYGQLWWKLFPFYCILAKRLLWSLCILELKFLNLIHYTLNHSLEIPSNPTNAKVIFVNQSAVKLAWRDPEITGYQTDVHYNVECRKTCNDDDVSNWDEIIANCGSQVGYLPSKRGLNETHVVITHLSSFVTYEFRIYAWNRVSGVAQMMHRIQASFTLHRVTTNASREFFLFSFSSFSVNKCTK